jgi:cysteine desulfurase/selenocysteine lyase
VKEDPLSHYLDYAATSAVRPDEVVDAVAGFLRENGASPGRGGHDLAIQSGRVAFRARRALTKVMGLPGDPGRLAFMFNATHSLNTALWGTLREGDTVVHTPFEHNAVLRPLHYLEKARGVRAAMIPGSPDGTVDLDEAARLLEGARLLVVNAVSNVLGSRLDVEPLASLAHERGALVLVDAAQSSGHLAVSHPQEGADLVAFTGHKGLLGPPGTGGLWVREGLEIDPFLTGGTGGNSSLREMPPDLPDRLEAGTVNAAGIAGLLAGATFVLDRGIEELHAQEMQLKARLWDGLDSIPGVQVVSPRTFDGVGVVTVSVQGVEPATVAARLNSEFGVMTRHGLHCAPEAHRLLGTLETGAVRLSLGWASTEEDVDAAIRGVDTIASGAVFAI